MRRAADAAFEVGLRGGGVVEEYIAALTRKMRRTASSIRAIGTSPSPTARSATSSWSASGTSPYMPPAVVAMSIPALSASASAALKWSGQHCCTPLKSETTSPPKPSSSFSSVVTR